MTRRSARFQQVLSAGGYRIGSPTAVLQNTTRSQDMTPDGYTWAQGGPMVIDNYGNLIANIQHYGAASAISNAVTVSGDNGATWSDPTLTGWFSADGEQFLTRGCFAYDTVNDKLHVLWVGGATDGVIYRRYGFTRDGSNKITAMTKDAINLQLDFQTTGTMEYQHPVLLWLNTGGNGTLIATWAAYNSAGAPKKTEVRMSKRALSNTVADNTAANWANLGSAGSTQIGNAPAVPYSVANNFNNVGIMYVSAGVKRSGSRQWDITLVYTSGGSDPILYDQYVPYSGGNWTTGNGPTTVCTLRRSGVDGGYSAKSQLVSEPRHDTTNDRMYYGFSTWNGTSDTWSFAYETSAGGVSALTDAYVSPGADNSANDFVTGDVAVFNGVGVFVTWTDLSAKDTYAALYSFGSTPGRTSGPTRIFSTAPCDIPTVYGSVVGGKALVLFRDFNAASTNNPPTYTPPYHGYFVTVPLTR